MNPELYIYGSEHPKDRGKVHIADQTGEPLCKSKIKWGEVTGVIHSIVNDEIYTTAFARPTDKIPSKSFGWMLCRCKKCEQKLKKLLDDK